MRPALTNKSKKHAPEMAKMTTKGNSPFSTSSAGKGSSPLFYVIIINKLRRNVNYDDNCNHEIKIKM